MGVRSTVTGYWRQRGANNSSSSKLPPTGPTPAVMLCVTPAITFDPTLVSTTLMGITLPKGSIPSHAKITNAGGTGGTTPTVDVGLNGGNADALIAEGSADVASAAILVTGTSLDAALAVDTEITAGVGASAATGGTVTVRVYFYMNDDGKVGDASPNVVP